MTNEEMFSQLMAAIQVLDTKLDETKAEIRNVEVKLNSVEAKLSDDIVNLRIEMRGEFNHLKNVVIDTVKTANKEINSVKVRIFDIEERLRS